jgi:hypothetical protein
MMNKWQIGPVKLANGEGAFIDAVNEGQDYCRYTGRMPFQGLLIAAGWDASGRLKYASSDNPGNLAPPPKKTLRVQRWLVIYKSGLTRVVLDKADATAEAKAFGFALIEIDREVEEGEGL